MKKILIFSLNYYPKYVGGAEVAIKEIVERQDKDKCDFHMITLRFDSDLPKFEIVHGIKVHRIGFTKKGASIAELKNSYLKYNKYLYQFYAGFYGLYLHKVEKFDGIWAMMAHSTGVPAGIFKTFVPKVKYILTLQEGDPPEQIERLAKPIWPLFKRGFTQADIVQSISTFLNNWAEKMGNKNKKVIIPNAVDVKQFTREISQTEINEVKSILGKKEGQVWLVTTSRLVHKNGIDDCINAIKILKDKNINVHFAVLGIGPDEDKLKNLVSHLDIADRVKFIGQISHPKMAVYLRACDIFIRPSRSEGMGNSFVEAMSMKMPVIATTEGGLSDFIFDGVTAFEVRKDNPESITVAVERIMNLNIEAKNKILNTAYDMVIEKYDWDKVARDMEEKVFSEI
jgi:glycosyltransferase involved in cell wall biosynthesis